jgi:hypothetical protein
VFQVGGNFGTALGAASRGFVHTAGGTLIDRSRRIRIVSFIR